MLPLTGNGERIKILRFDSILKKKGRYSSLDLGTISERNQNGEIVSVNLGTLTNSQIVVSHTFIGDGERERYQWPKPGLPQIASSIWPKPEEQSRARAAWASPQSHRIHAATPVTTQHETEDRTDLNEPSSNCLAVGIHGRNLKTLESAVGINSNPPAKATVLDMHA